MIRLECSKIDEMNGTIVRHEFSVGSFSRADRIRASMEADGFRVSVHRDHDLERAGNACVAMYRETFCRMPQSFVDAVQWARTQGLLTEIEAGSLEYYYE